MENQFPFLTALRHTHQRVSRAVFIMSRLLDGELAKFFAAMARVYGELLDGQYITDTNAEFHIENRQLYLSEKPCNMRMLSASVEIFLSTASPGLARRATVIIRRLHHNQAEDGDGVEHGVQAFIMSPRWSRVGMFEVVNGRVPSQASRRSLVTCYIRSARSYHVRFRSSGRDRWMISHV
jgi:hypothetical protein